MFLHTALSAASLPGYGSLSRDMQPLGLQPSAGRPPSPWQPLPVLNTFRPGSYPRTPFPLERSCPFSTRDVGPAQAADTRRSPLFTTPSVPSPTPKIALTGHRLYCGLWGAHASLEDGGRQDRSAGWLASSWRPWEPAKCLSSEALFVHRAAARPSPRVTAPSSLAHHEGSNDLHFSFSPRSQFLLI